jgi:hypothetical protein
MVGCRPKYLLPVLLLAIGLTCGCTGRYFRPAPTPPSAPLQESLSTLRWQEYWTGIIFNGEKIGFSRTSIRPAADEPGRFVIESEASLLFRLLGFQKSVQMRSEDVVEADLTLVRLRYWHNLDGTILEISGEQHPGVLRTTVVTRGRTTQQEFATPTPVFPAGALTLLPVVRGLEVGHAFRYQIYSGETQSLLDVRQKVQGYEESELFSGAAYRVETSASGYRTTSWIEAQGRPQLELALNGVMISALETSTEAKHYLTLAALNKRETLVDFSLVRPDRSVTTPRATTYLKLEVANAPAAPPDGPGQRCTARERQWICEIVAGGIEPAFGTDPRARYLGSTVTVPADTRAIGDTANEIIGTVTDPTEQVSLLLRWLQINIRHAPVDAFSALDVLAQREAECQGHAYLYAALARALGIPTRVVNGLAYAESAQGFLYHSWAESYLDGGWRAIDPTFGQPAADATHLKLVEGESIAELIPLTEWMGKVQIRVLDQAP